jgi:hypothetical protein
MKARKLNVIYSRVDLSHYHLYSAFLFADFAERTESTAAQMANSDILYQYRSFVMGAVLSSVAFLEAAFAELQSDVADPTGVSAVVLTAVERFALSEELSKLGRKALLDRYQIALRALGKPMFDRDKGPFRQVPLLIQLRNHLIHFPAEWLADTGPDSEPLPQADWPLIDRQLKGQFPSTKFASKEQPFFPFHCLSAGCALWAAEASLAFRQEFSTRAGTVMKQLKPKIAAL